MAGLSTGGLEYDGYKKLERGNHENQYQIFTLLLPKSKCLFIT